MDLSKRSLATTITSIAVLIVLALSSYAAARSVKTTNPGLSKVNHIIIAMQENHSFDSYFGVLPYHSNGLFRYHSGRCKSKDHSCVDALSCERDASGNYTCTNSNRDDDGSTAFSFHSKNYCPSPDLDHGWASTHQEANLKNPNDALASMPDDGFVIVNDKTEQVDTGETPIEDDTMGFYNEDDLPYYYGLAETFAISDRYFCDVLGPTFPNRSYLQAATSFGHLTTSEEIPPFGGYKPITGTIYDRLDAAGITWADYFNDLPDAGTFRNPVVNPTGNFRPFTQYAIDLQAGNLPQVVFLDPQLAGESNLATDEHPPHDIRAGENYMQTMVVDPLRQSSSWKDSILFITYDEHGGLYDHAPSPAAPQDGALTPDGIAPGQCADNSAAPASTMPGGGANCTSSATSDAPGLCQGFTPTGPYPEDCANFNQLGLRVPFIAVSPFSKRHYVSHVTADHTAILAMLEKRFNLKPLTKRDAANLQKDPLEDLFDFAHAPSQSVDFTKIPAAPMANLVTDGNGDCAPAQASSGLPMSVARSHATSLKVCRDDSRDVFSGLLKGAPSHSILR
jgi:phospholipase C